MPSRKIEKGTLFGAENLRTERTLNCRANVAQSSPCNFYFITLRRFSQETVFVFLAKATPEKEKCALKAKKTSRIISLLLAVLMTVGMLPISSIAAAAEEAESKTPYVLLYSKTCKNSETEKLYPGFSSKKYGNKATLTKDGTLWLEDYDAGPINAFGFENFTVALKGDNKIYHDSTKHEYDAENGSENGCFLRSAIMAFNFSGYLNSPENLTVRSYSATEKGNITITSVAPKGQWGSYQAFGGSSFTDIRALTGNKVVLNNVNLSFSIDGKEDDDYGWYAATAIYAYGGLYISNSTVDGEILNVLTDDLFTQRITAIYTKDGDTSVINSDINIIFDNCRSRSGTLSGIWNGGTGNINIKNSNVNIRDDSRGVPSRYAYGIANSCTGSEEYLNKNRLNITDNSVVTLEGNSWDYGICDDFGYTTKTESVGVTVNGSSLKISGVDKGLYTPTRGVNFTDAKVEIRSQAEAVAGAAKNESPYGLRISGSSVVNLTSTGSKVVAMSPLSDYKYIRSRIELSQGGEVNITAYNAEFEENVTPMCDYVSLGANNKVTKGSVAATLSDSKTGTTYARYYGEKDPELTTVYFSVRYADVLNPRWYTDSNRIVWKKGVSPTDEYQLYVEAAPNTGDTPVYTEIFTAKVSGSSYTLPAEVTDYFIDTVYYRIKIIPLISNYLSETVGYSNVKAAKKQVENIKLNKSGTMLISWEEVKGASKYYFEILKYNEEIEAYECCESSPLESCNINIYSNFNKAKWFGEGKYRVTVKALFGDFTETNLLASGELSEPLEVKYYSLSYGDYTGSNFFLQVERDSTAVYVKSDKLLAGDKITLNWTGSGTNLNGWYLNSRFSGMERTVSDDKYTISFVMPSANVTAYPLIGVEEITDIELWYNRIAVSTLSEVTDGFNNETYHGESVNDVQIDWYGEDGILIDDPTAAVIDSSKNYVGNVTVYPTKGELFTDNSVVSLFDYYDETNNALAEITNGKVENGCYTFKLYLINHAVVTVPRKANGGYDYNNITTGDVCGVSGLYSFEYTGSTTKQGTTCLSGARLIQQKGEALFGNTVKVKLNGNEYSAEVDSPGLDFAEACFTSSPVIYSNNSVPVLNYESGTTFYADNDIETEISVVTLKESYKKALFNQKGMVYYQSYYQLSDGTLCGNGSPVQSVGVDDAIVFKTRGGWTSSQPVKITLTVWVDNGPKLTYYYYAVDALGSSQAYTPKLSVEGPTRFKDRLEVKLVNPLPNLTYYYENDYDFDSMQDNFPGSWNTIEYNGNRIIVRESERLRIIGKGIKPTEDGEGEEAYTKKNAAESYIRIYDKPVLNVKNNSWLDCKSDGTLADCIKLDDYYAETLSKNAKVHYTVNDGDEKVLDSIDSYFPIALKGSYGNYSAKITVWIDGDEYTQGSENATYYYNASTNTIPQLDVYPSNNSTFGHTLKVMLKCSVPNCNEFQYAIIDDNGTVGKYKDFTNYLTLIRENDAITVGTDKTDKKKVKLAFRTVFANGASSYTTAEFELYDLTGKATYAIVDGNVTLDASKPYYVDGQASAKDDATKRTARFDAETGMLELTRYGGRSIYTNGDTYIRLGGYASTVNGTIKCDGDLHIDGSVDLYVNPFTVSDNTIKAFDVKGDLRISTSSTVDIDIYELDPVDNAYGIKAQRFYIDGKASLDISIKNPMGNTYGIYSEGISYINTLGNISINVINGVYNYGSSVYEPIYSGNTTTVAEIGLIKMQHPARKLFGGNEKTLVLASGIYSVQDYYRDNAYYITEIRKGNTIADGSKAVVTGTVITSGSPEKPITLQLIAEDGTVYQALTLYGNSAPFSFYNIPLGNYTLKLSKAGHLPYEISVEVEDIYDKISISASMKMPSISGTVTAFGSEEDTVTVELWKKGGTSAEESFVSKGNTVYYSFNNNGKGLDTASEYYVVVKKNNHSDYQSYDISFGSVMEKDIDIVLTLEAVKVSGSIKFEDSAAEPTITFTEVGNSEAGVIEPMFSRDESFTPTDYNALLRPEARYIMTVKAEGYQTYITYITTSYSPIEHNILLLKDNGETAALSGKVTSSGDESATITITLTLNGESEPSYERVLSGNSAYYEITDIPVGIYTLKAEKAGHRSWSTSFVIGYSDRRQDINLTKIAGAYVGGNVTSHGDEDDVITIWLVKDTEDIPSYETTVYGNSTAYSFYGVEDGDYTLIVIKNGHLPSQQTVSVKGADISADITMYLVGDVNGDGELDIRDLVRLKKIVSGEAKPAEGTTADLNGDGNVDASDLVILRKMLLGITESNSGVTLSGTVTSYGDETADITIQLIPYEATEAAYTVTVNGNNAAYSIANVQRGSYTLRVITDKSVTREYSLVIGSANVTQDIIVYLTGDVNGDGAVDILDLIRLKKINAATATAEKGTSADINADGAENSADLVDLRKMLLA